MVTVVVVSNAGQGGEAAMEYFTVYVPGVLAAAVIVPVVVFIASPEPALKAPPGVPVTATATLPSDVHIGGYFILAEGVLLIDTFVVVVKTAHPPKAFMV